MVRSQPILTGGFCWAETFPNGFAFIHTANSPSKGFVLPKGENTFAWIHSFASGHEAIEAALCPPVRTASFTAAGFIENDNRWSSSRAPAIPKSAEEPEADE